MVERKKILLVFLHHLEQARHEYMIISVLFFDVSVCAFRANYLWGISGVECARYWSWPFSPRIVSSYHTSLVVCSLFVRFKL